MSRKDARELQVGRIIARTLNAADGSDYEPHPGPRLPAPPDIELRSVTGSRPALGLEVTSAPLAAPPGEKPLRRDREDFVKLRAEVLAHLVRAGLNDARLRITLQDTATASMVKGKHVDALARFVASCPSGESRALHGSEVRDYDRDLSRVLVSLSVLRMPARSRTTVIFGAASAVPTTGRWIEEAVEQKRTRYADDVARHLMLAVDCDFWIDADQARAYRDSDHARSVLFTEVWVVSKWFDPVRAKA